MSKTCTKCGTEVANELPGGMCPACLMSVARHSIDERATTGRENQGFDVPTLAELGNSFPELEILEFIGRGGMGAVYKARQKNLDRVVALKVFLYRPNDPEFAARFEREARALGRLNHPNVVTVYEFGSRGNFHFLTMEFVDGLNLRQLTTEEKLSPEMALQLVPQLCDALQYAHDKGVIHRDIKPENLLVDTDGRIKIADFGLAKMTNGNFNGTLTHTRQVMGTLNYMAPEQRERPTEVDHRADIYSLGVVIYELLTGELPLGRFQPPSSKSAVASELDEVVMRALEKEPERRYQQASEFKTGFQSHGYAPPVNQAYPQMAANVVPQAIPAPPIKTPVSEAPSGTRAVISIMSGREKKGEWVPGNPTLGFTLMGGTCLDLTAVKAKSVDLTLFTMMGGTEVIVPQGAQVDCDGFILMGATTNSVNSASDPNGMRVRIRSWGAMGGCEVRSVTRKEQRDQRVLEEYNKGELHEGTIFGHALAFAHHMFALFVTISIPLFFIARSMGVFDQGKLYGIMAAMLAGLLWCTHSHFRVIVSAGPDEDLDDEGVRDYYSSTKFGAFLRCIALIFIFVCPTLFILESYDFGTSGLMKFSAIACAVVGFMFFGWASQYDEFRLGKKTSRDDMKV